MSAARQDSARSKAEHCNALPKKSGRSRQTTPTGFLGKKEATHPAVFLFDRKNLQGNDAQRRRSHSDTPLRQRHREPPQGRASLLAGQVRPGQDRHSSSSSSSSSACANIFFYGISIQ
ncbi:hypothetical protein PLESTB_001056800 [Pleodorina starrii]|uniref:Uncharacterized protein n=1 Tax=Pleodorina starrii TaxID=330485 RepID=A0A9W6BQ38_9CHLO|nr:hypothetical protein PLESTB_001056800 [Pleodorina starrii]